MPDEIEIFVPIYPPSANMIWRNRKGTNLPYLAKPYRLFKTAVERVVNGYKMPADWRFCEVELILHPTRRAGDEDNRIKPVLDALTRAHFWADDSCVARVMCRFGRVDKTGSVCILVRKCDVKFPIEGD